MVKYGLNKPLVVKPRNGQKKEQKKKPSFGLTKFAEFCQRTDLHGYKYIFMDGLSKVERCFWSLAVLLSVIVAAYFVVLAYRWYARNPIVTVIESTHGPIWTVPFPAVTICDLNSISKKAARSFADTIKLPRNVTADNVFEAIRLAPLLQTGIITGEDKKHQLFLLQSALDQNNVTLKEFYTKVSPVSPCSRLVERCMWKHSIYRCDLLFKPVFTVLNLCCTFNYFAVDDNDVQTSEYFQMPAPRRVASCGYQTALTVLLKTDPSDYYSANVASQGFLVLIDDAYNLPDLNSPVRIVNPQTELLIALSPERTYSTPGIKTFTPEQRNCYFTDEVKLGKFREYSLHNCVAYRRVQVIRSVCQCVPFFFPYDDSSRVCNFYDIDCLENLMGDADETVDMNTGKTGTIFPKCYAGCEHYEYALEVALGMLTKNIKFNRIAFYNDINLVNRSVLNVFFNDLVSTRYRRDVYLNWQNILASVGGLLSLMLGFTLISGFDLVFFALRVAFEFIKQNKTVSPSTKVNDDIQRSHVY